MNFNLCSLRSPASLHHVRTDGKAKSDASLRHASWLTNVPLTLSTRRMFLGISDNPILHIPYGWFDYTAWRLGCFPLMAWRTVAKNQENPELSCLVEGVSPVGFLVTCLLNQLWSSPHNRNFGCGGTLEPINRRSEQDSHQQSTWRSLHIPRKLLELDSQQSWPSKTG